MTNASEVVSWSEGRSVQLRLRDGTRPLHAWISDGNGQRPTPLVIDATTSSVSFEVPAGALKLVGLST